jgi:hypothetical protein
MKSLFHTLFFFLLIIQICFAQGVGINTTNAAADPSAILDLSSTTQGFLPPRMSETEKLAISTPATGLLIYQTDGTSGLYYFNGTEWETFENQKHFIGETYGGGKVFCVDATGQHGLIASPNYVGPTYIMWAPGNYSVTLATGDGFGSGQMNTSIIVSSQGIGDGSDYAARLCSELIISEGGIDYGDWYLPSKYELNLMYLQRGLLGLNTREHWSSTEYDENQVWMQSFLTGLQHLQDKLSPLALLFVRAIRAF